MADYNLDLTATQQSILNWFTTQYPNYPVRAWDIPDSENVEYWPNTTSMKPHIFLWFSKLRRNPRRRGGSLISYKLDQYESGFDVLVVSEDATTSNNVANLIADDIIGFKPTRSGGISKGTSISDMPMQVPMNNNKPRRWVSTDRYRFVPFAQKVVP